MSRPPASAAANVKAASRPLLKWAGGKTQLLPALLSRMPRTYKKYVEPFFGGGALFFAVRPSGAVIADSNPELINLYRAVATDVESVIDALTRFENTESEFYETRALDWRTLTPAQAAARTIFLNRTCFNGLYRVNRKGQFNVPFGRYKNPRLVDRESLLAASRLLRDNRIVEGDYLAVLREHAEEGDFVFLDPPYLPVSEFADFKRYTKEQFYEDDHRDLANEVRRLSSLGCHVLLTNSNHPLVHELYGEYTIHIESTRRSISSHAHTRTGEDVIVCIPPAIRQRIKAVPSPISAQVDLFPSTRFMGSKRRLLQPIWNIASQFSFKSVLDLFSGSGVVSYMFKAQGKRVFANDHMRFAATIAKALIENSDVLLTSADVEQLTAPHPTSDGFVSNTFAGLYFSDDENAFIDRVRANIREIDLPAKRSLAMAALIRACMKRRPRGIFTYTGDRYNDGRRDLTLSIREHFLEAVQAVNAAVFSNGAECVARVGDALALRGDDVDLVYLDPPYYSPYSDNEYVRRYHFVEGLARDWKGVTVQEHTTTKKFRSYPTPFSSHAGAATAFRTLFQRYRKSVLIVSYSSNSLPTLKEMTDLLAEFKANVEVVPVEHTYSFGNQGSALARRNRVQEYLFVGY